MRASMPSPTSSEHYAPAVDLSTSTTSSASPFGLYGSEQPLYLSEDRLIRRACRHSPNCSRSAQTGKPSCRECAAHDLHDALRGCPACQSASIVTALTFGEATGQAQPTLPSIVASASATEAGQAAADEPATAAELDEYELALADLLDKLVGLVAHTAPAGRFTSDQVRQVYDTQLRLAFVSPELVQRHAHEERPVVATLGKLEARCSRCERVGHSRAQCRNACAACGIDWPHCGNDCPMRYDDSSEILMEICSRSHPPVMTTDLDKEEFELRPLVNAATSPFPGAALARTPDAEVIERFSDVMHSKFVPRFPALDDLQAKQWLAIADAGQVARLCRAVGTVQQTTEQYSAAEGAPDALRGDAEARTAVRAAYCQLRDVVLAVRDEVDAILSAAWHI